MRPGLAVALAGLPTTIGAPEVADLMGVPRWSVYEAARNGTLPPGLEPIRIGRRMYWPTVRVLELMGLIESSDATAADRSPSTIRGRHAATACSRLALVGNSKT